MMSVFELLALMTLGVMTLVSMVFWVMMLADCVSRERHSKLAWFVGFLMAPLPVAFAYGVSRYLPRVRAQREQLLLSHDRSASPYAQLGAYEDPRDGNL